MSLFSALSDKALRLHAQVDRFILQWVIPAEARFAAELQANRDAGDPWRCSQVLEELKSTARNAGLWNLFLPNSDLGGGLHNLEYAPLCELMGRSPPAAVDDPGANGLARSKDIAPSHRVRLRRCSPWTCRNSF
jgi:alkylation response protein AidB-like acyl-CoA dehydrogenase